MFRGLIALSTRPKTALEAKEGVVETQEELLLLVGSVPLLLLDFTVQMLKPGDNRIEVAVEVADFSPNVVEVPSQIVDSRVVPIHTFRQEDHRAEMFPKLLPQPLLPREDICESSFDPGLDLLCLGFDLAGFFP